MSLFTLFRPDQQATRARVRSTACRGYVAELDPQDESRIRLVTRANGNVVHFRTLHQTRAALRRRGVTRAVLVQQHACEEIGALGTSTRPEQGIVLFDDSAA